MSDSETSNIPAGKESKDQRFQLCLVGDASLDQDVWEKAEILKVKAVSSQDEVHWHTATTIFVLDQFDGPVYKQLKSYSYRLKLLGTAALKRLETYEDLVRVCSRHRPYSLVMWGLVICVSGVQDQHQRRNLAKLIRHMGGRACVDWSRTLHSVTHVVATHCGGESYWMANTFEIPVLDPSWVLHCWQRCQQEHFFAEDPAIIESHKLKIFQGSTVCFLGFSEDEEKNMAEILSQNGGIHSRPDEPNCTHMVVKDSQKGVVAIQAPSEIFVVQERWFWKSYDDGYCADELQYIVNHYNENYMTLKRYETMQWKQSTKNNKQEQANSGVTLEMVPVEKDETRQINELENGINPQSDTHNIYENIYITSQECTVQKESLRPNKSLEDDCGVTSTYKQPPAILRLGVSHNSLTDIMLHPSQADEPPSHHHTPNQIKSSNYIKDDESFHSDCISQFDDLSVNEEEEPLSNEEPVSLRGSSESPSLIKANKPVYKAESLLRKVMSWIQTNQEPSPAINGSMRSWKGEHLKGLSRRQQIFQELLNTERHYNNVLHVIMWLFKAPVCKYKLLKGYEMNLIFGKLEPIYKAHCCLLQNLKNAEDNWSENISIGSVVLETLQPIDMLKAYQPYFNSFENANDILEECEQKKEEFQKIEAKAKSVSERWSLKELRSFPLLRLGQMIILLRAIQEATIRTCPDFDKLQEAIERVDGIIKQLNKKKGLVDSHHDALQAMIIIYNEIEKCPPNLISADHSFVVKCDVLELGDGLANTGNKLVFILFTDIIEVTKVNSSKTKRSKPFIHIRQMPLFNICKVVDIEDCTGHTGMFALNYKDSHDEFYIHTDKKIDKKTFLWKLCEQLAAIIKVSDKERFLEVTTFETSIHNAIQKVG